jgi:hypothetical protein
MASEHMKKMWRLMLLYLTEKELFFDFLEYARERQREENND